MRPGSIDALYRESVRQQPYMRTDAVSELDKLVYMIFADELESLLDMKGVLRSEPQSHPETHKARYNQARMGENLPRQQDMPPERTSDVRHHGRRRPDTGPATEPG